MKKRKNLALVAHDHRKNDLVQWIGHNYKTLSKHNLTCTGTTGTIVEDFLKSKMSANDPSTKPRSVQKLKSGPLGGDQQLGALISEGKIDILIFFWDPMQPQPHDVDVKALLRIAVLYNIPVACNRSSADFIISSSLFNETYERRLVDYSGYIERKII